MTPWLDNLARHGPSLLFAVCLVEALGLPIPAAVALITAGALVASAKMTLLSALLASGAGLLIGDLVYFVLGRKTGWWLLGILCRLSVNPESCILSSAEAFYRRGRLVLIFAKFVPGLNTMAPPLAGSMNMAFFEFLALDSAGVLLYTGTYIGAGFAFRDLLSALLDTMGRAGSVIEGVLVTAIAAYIAYRLWLFWKHRTDESVPRAELADVDGPVFDVRSHGYYDAGAQRIQGSTRLEPNRIAQTLSTLPEAEKIYLYCT